MKHLLNQSYHYIIVQHAEPVLSITILSPEIFRMISNNVRLRIKSVLVDFKLNLDLKQVTESSINTTHRTINHCKYSFY